ncbi:hypothetical protein [Bombilactobacillus thymidiniphilus]|uniref:Uncharacterized protein n=1 Tax=Bombilactobacillus thymidiniphilus TaxID=2923363 RepID=A0ABY4PF77_9LACO|nr:hypothetical protein [Bombilactobacillus thymidiniphilus]UQS84174.1 hypothetical protein MOO47_03215 [Bombilactobacillus thymidiniphilus]
MTKIASNQSAASAAAASAKSMEVSKGKTATVAVSNISGMTKAMEINNGMLAVLSQLVKSVQTQSAKFPQIAKLIAQTDRNIKF